jgi:hypothetical protein
MRSKLKHMILSERSQYEKATSCRFPVRRHFEKRKIKTVERAVVIRIWGLEQ